MGRDYMTRVDDGILLQAAGLARLRGLPIRGGIRDFRASAAENLELSRGTADEDIWRTRLDRANALLLTPSDDDLRKRLREAREADR